MGPWGFGTGWSFRHTMVVVLEGLELVHRQGVVTLEGWENTMEAAVEQFWTELQGDRYSRTDYWYSILVE